MINYENKNTHDLSLSQDTLRSLRNELAEAVIRFGSIETNQDAGITQTPGESLPRVFSYPLTEYEGSFFPEGDVKMIDASILYATPRDLDGEPEGHKIFIQAEGVLANASMNNSDQRITIDMTFVIRETVDGELEGEKHTEYAQGDYRISPNDIPQSDLTMMSEDQREALLADMHELTSQLTLDDAEVLRDIAHYIQQHPTR